MKLNNISLFQQSCYINGKWANTKKTINVKNPATEKIIGTVPDLDPTNIHDAIIAAELAWPIWRSKTALERGELLYRWYTLILENINDLALLLTLEQGKPLKEAMEEIRYGASFIQWFAEEGKRIYGDIIPAPLTKQHLFVSKQSVGVVGAITPWNFPNAMITRKCAPALAAGCTIILKPSVLTPFSALALAVLAEKAGIPAGVFNIVTGDSEMIGNIFTDSPSIRKLSFTGSTAVGKLIMQKAANSVKKISLELGGNAPFIVFDDADIDQAILGAIASKFRNSGQTCICTNRFYIHEKIYEIFTEKLAHAIQQLKVGNGLEDNIQIGPLINAAAIKKVEKHIADALQQGAELVYGGKVHALGGNFFQPTLLKNCTDKMLIAKEETFGPIAALFKFSEEQEVIHLANATEYGLAAYFYTQNVNRVIHVAEQLDYGIVGANTGRASNAVAPFGGFKQSGIGREGSKYGIEDYLEIKYVCLNTD
ncbi:NAD-dependent succinate-semialdehyde dehydrogenase [Rickettsiella endosymbiont of Rhagonycha lignosa]|uniref:NAD-dependent succinate-semialdehyde dehydrogenase n=1 Tax=Rickettsiella endosymbiont of Rhagonycha lignosa TaxID=3077937 RepID=UPI00313E5AE0